MTTARKVRPHVRRVASPIPPGILGFLLGEPFDPDRHSEGRLQVFLQDPAELLEAYLPQLTLTQRRRALRVARLRLWWRV